MTRERLVPLIVAVALFMENMDSTVIATSLPAIAVDIGTDPLALKLAVTSYLLALAIFIPGSGWTADRFGARTVFRLAIAVFIIGSIGCALSESLHSFVVARFLQGMGGAMMAPVGRLVLMRSVDKRNLVDAMTWVTMPALIGPLLGPPLGGFITTFFSWHWIFIINVPIGLAGIALATKYIENIRGEVREPFDPIGMVLAGLGIGGIAFGLTAVGLKDFLPAGILVGMIAGGALCIFLYILHARRTPAPVMDLSLFRLPSFRAGVAGGFLYRVGAGALPFLLPLMLQVGFHKTPFQSGMITFATAVGAMSMKTAIPTLLRRFGYRNVLTWNALVSSAFIAACALFTASTPIVVMLAVLFAGGFFRSLQFTSAMTVGYAEVEPRRMSRATSLAAVSQQLSVSTGVALGALVVATVLTWRHESVIEASDFAPAFLLVGGIAALSSLIFWRMPPNAGAELTDRRLAPAEPTGPADPPDKRAA
ncbi:MAG TPA: DHA2 family efflux MFS transporter permease subunit [Xanthobacteraceae bacterium]|jgi:EmrB/QacA subfamily drug resistance transporter|nr:DHA2 family efflux MFS transporter permease subunit [Xanthobacteraceae bacterium]